MPPLAEDRNTLERSGDSVAHPLAAATIIFAGSLVALDAAGNAVPGSVATTLTAAGRAEEQVDNSAGAAGDLSVLVRRGVFQFKNSAGDPIDRTHIGGTAYIEDDETVSATDGTGTRSAAGKIIDLDSAGVWIEIG
jgi:hypothetical protein